MFSYLSWIFGGQPIERNTTTTLVDNSIKGTFKYAVRMSCGGNTEFDVIVTTDDLNKRTSWQCPKCRKSMNLPRLGRARRSPFDNEFLHYEGTLMRTCYGNGHGGRIKEVIEYDED